jgi:hypothetical protein
MDHFHQSHGIVHATMGKFAIVTMLPSMVTVKTQNSHMMYLDIQLSSHQSKTIIVAICDQTHTISFGQLALGVMTQGMRAIAQCGTQKQLSS